MYKRIRDGLFDPKRIVEFINDKPIDVILFLLFFVIFLTAPAVFIAIDYDISYDTKSAIIEEFKGEDIKFEIKNGELVYKSSDTGYIKENETYALAIGNAKASNEYATVLRFNDDSITLEISFFKFKVIDYLDYEESANLKLYDLTSGNNETWEQVFKLANNYIDDKPGIFIVLPVIFQFFVNIGSLLLVALIISVGALLRLRGVVKFSKIYKLNIYCLGPFAFGAFFDELFNINLIYIIGIIITFVYSYITQIEVFKKVYSQHTEG